MPPGTSVRQILVVDDLPANLVAAEAALAPLGLPIVFAGSGDEALARLLEQDFALILLDVQMPGLDGYETARLIRARDRSRHVPIIFFTAFDHDDAAVLRAYELGAVDFLFKPVLPEVLRAKAAVFVTLQERTEQLAAERMEREYENRRREELARLNEALAESDRRKDSFIAILAHELRNPLAPVRTCIDLIREDPSHAIKPKLLDILDRQTGILARLVDDLLDLSRMKADKIELRPEHVDLVDIVDNAIATSRSSIDERRHALIFDAPTARLKVVADTLRLAQVLANLLNNAARYTPRGGRIHVTCAADDEWAYVRVKDNGVGIPKELQETIFKMFVQERVSSDGSGGLGLGLALSRRLIEMHHGTITVHSAGRDMGSTFTIRLPLATSSQAIAPRKRTREMERMSPEPTRSVRTVVVDDNRDARELLGDLLRGRGYEVLTAGDGPSGLQLIREQRPDVALVDLGLPGLDGVGIVETLRRECPDLETRLVALSGYGNSGDLERTRRAGFHAHLVKPASAAVILACLAEQLDNKS
ncbi:MAG TPA: response regulator [Kofleriaceae bacterium]